VLAVGADTLSVKLEFVPGFMTNVCGLTLDRLTDLCVVGEPFVSIERQSELLLEKVEEALEVVTWIGLAGVPAIL
jgi:hypothetical protein